MSRTALVFFPHNPYPTQSVANHRCMSILRALQALGYNVTLLSSAQFTDSPWTPESIAYLQNECEVTVKVHEPTEIDRSYTRLAGSGQGDAVNFSMFTPPGLRQCFRETFHQICPELILVSYSLWGGLAIGDEFRSVLRILDTVSLSSKNVKMRHALNQHIHSTPMNVEDVDSVFVGDGFLSNFDCADSPEESWICDQYNYTIAISAHESIRQNFLEQRLIEQLSSILDNPRAAFGQRSEDRFPKVVVDAVFFQITQTTGIARVWQSILAEWIKTGFANHIVVLDRGGTAPRLEGIRYRSLHRHDTMEYHDATHHHSDHPTGLDAEILQAICDEESADVFISTYYTTPISTSSVFMGYDMIPEALKMDLNAPAWQEKRYGILHASHYITISESTGRDLRRFFPYIEPNQVTVAYCGWDPLFSPAGSEEIKTFQVTFGIEKPYFLLVGHRLGYSGYKNSTLLFEALNQIEHKEAFSVLCVGGQPELESELQNLAQGITIHLAHLTNEELRVAYSGAVALAYPSHYEGFGLPIVEAMACGCPVITCRTSSIPEVAGEAVIYIDPFNANELAIALETVQNPSIRENLRSQGFAQVQRFSWAKMADIVAETITQTAKEMSHSALRRQDLLWSEFRKAQQEKNALYQQHQSLEQDKESLYQQYQSLEQEKNVLYQQQQSLIQRLFRICG